MTYNEVVKIIAGDLEHIMVIAELAKLNESFGPDEYADFSSFQEQAGQILRRIKG
jgi:hypothetical protein